MKQKQTNKMVEKEISVFHALFLLWNLSGALNMGLGESGRVVSLWQEKVMSPQAYMDSCRKLYQTWLRLIQYIFS
jgi:hypothetical protein